MRKQAGLPNVVLLTPMVRQLVLAEEAFEPLAVTFLDLAIESSRTAAVLSGVTLEICHLVEKVAALLMGAMEFLALSEVVYEMLVAVGAVVEERAASWAGNSRVANSLIGAIYAGTGGSRSTYPNHQL